YAAPLNFRNRARRGHAKARATRTQGLRKHRPTSALGSAERLLATRRANDDFEISPARGIGAGAAVTHAPPLRVFRSGFGGNLDRCGLWCKPHVDYPNDHRKRKQNLCGIGHGATFFGISAESALAVALTGALRRRIGASRGCAQECQGLDEPASARPVRRRRAGARTPRAWSAQCGPLGSLAGRTAGAPRLLRASFDTISLRKCHIQSTQ